MKKLLDGLRVFDASDSHSYGCGRFLASLGAEVVHVEPVGGDNLRHSAGPKSLTNQCDSAYWQSQNIGKKSITLNLDTDRGVALCKDLITHCDFFIESFTPGYLTNKQLDYSRLATINPALIMVSITPFGQTGPYAHYKGGELVASAMGGVLDTCGYHNDTPVLEALDACTFHANATASMGAMLAYRERGLSGKGQQIDVSIQEVAASRNTNNLIAYQFDRRKLVRAGNCVRFGVATVRVVWELKDGYCFHSMMTGKFGAPANAALSQWMSDLAFDNPMAAVNWETYDRSALPADTRATWEAAMAKFFRSLSKEDIRTEGYRRGIRATVANTPEDVLKDPHLNAREFIQTLRTDNASVSYPAYFVKSSVLDTQVPPLLSKPGQHNREVYGDWLQLNASELDDLQKEGVI